ncbi:MAG TPA: DUF6600 domain-containing protein [Verrucomicrobiae bacterium]
MLNTRADLEVSGSVQIRATAEFNAPLAAHGTWVEVGSYGRCWRPGYVVVGWRPYCTGEWVWTDCGWYWSSDEPWGWACYHYGSWAYDAGFGWVWVPGVEWAPAWVSWRVGGGYIGWAPLPPAGLIFKHRPAPDHFVFVGSAHFGGPVVSSSLVLKNGQVFAKTSEIGGIKRESRSLGGSGPQKVMFNNGPAPDLVREASGKSLATVPIHDAIRRSSPPKQVAQASKQPALGRTDKSPGGRPDQAKDRGGDPGNSHGQDAYKPSGDRPSRSGYDRPSGGGGGGGHRGGGGRGKH